MNETKLNNYKPEPSVAAGLEDVQAGVSEICFIDGKEGRLLYSGYDIKELVEKTTFEEVVYLLWNGELPSVEQLHQLKRQIAEYQSLPTEVVDVIKLISKRSAPMDTLRTTVSLLKSFDDEGEEMTPEANYRKAVKLVAMLPMIVAAIERTRNDLDLVEPKPGLSIAANFLYMLKGIEADPYEVRIMDAGLIMHADHEFNASTFACRVTAGTLSDVYSAVTSGIGTLKGPLHGGANTAVMDMLLEIGDIEKAEDYVQAKLDRREKIMGFGHRVYKTMDPRAEQLREMSRELAERQGNDKWFLMTEKVFEVINDEKGLWPNVDLYTASVYYVLGIKMDLYTAIFAMSRISGWTAHILEQYENNRLIRPTAAYQGPSLRPVVAINER
ncbi:citrate synthase [Ammoniphilus oxalaticus]|uniref:Citrate synthase n=1 Tax=Ammoniphilus oxalaticus TaxID=66863 RepID=A0A419SG12_9BACL|nr:citrate/2-methylcitrate synthase [Ammoniphilus oxalaticus]RKD22731.1 citrate synthase [Ammoniphilus oxalaticus]